MRQVVNESVYKVKDYEVLTIARLYALSPPHVSGNKVDDGKLIK